MRPRAFAAFAAFLRLELAEALRSKWVAFSSSLYVALGVAFVWLGLRESSVLGFTGISRVLLNITSALIVTGPLLVLIATHAAIVRGRTSGFCELMLTQPVTRGSWFAAVLASRLVILVGPFLVLLLACAVATAVIGPDSDLLWIAIKSLAICVSLIFSFAGVGLLVSASCRTTERALIIALVIFVGTAALHDVLLISVLLRTSLSPWAVFTLAALNPSEAARVGILASADPELSVLGPVGFWLANTLGPLRAVAIGIAWPATVGALATWAALWRTRRVDLVA